MYPRNQDYFSAHTQVSEKAVAGFMSQVYLWMMVGIAISGISAYVVANNPNMFYFFVKNTPVFYGLIIFQLIIVFALSLLVQRMSVGIASFTYALYATLTGITFSVLFMIYTMQSIGSAFFVTAFSFAGLSFYGYTTKRDLGPIGAFCMMALFGLIAVMLLGLFVPSIMGSKAQVIVSLVGTLIFAGLTAYDTQRIKAMQFQLGSHDEARKGAIYGAFVLYLDFINLFLNILRLMGDRR